jgi:hypothetical protein
MVLLRPWPGEGSPRRLGVKLDLEVERVALADGEQIAPPHRHHRSSYRRLPRQNSTEVRFRGVGTRGLKGTTAEIQHSRRRRHVHGLEIGAHGLYAYRRTDT